MLLISRFWVVSSKVCDQLVKFSACWPLRLLNYIGGLLGMAWEIWIRWSFWFFTVIQVLHKSNSYLKFLIYFPSWFLQIFFWTSFLWKQKKIACNCSIDLATYHFQKQMFNRFSSTSLSKTKYCFQIVASGILKKILHNRCKIKRYHNTQAWKMVWFLIMIWKC